jgi:hypothetical protein
VILYYLGIVLLPLFGALDYFVAPAHLFHSFLTLRLAAAVVLLATLLVAYPTVGKRHPVLLGIAGPPIVGGSVSLMTLPMGGYESPYYAGLNLVILGVTLVMPFSLRESALTCGLVYATYFIPNLFVSNAISRPDLFLNNNFFIIGTIIIALISSHYSQKLRFHEFRSRLQLSQTNEKLTALDEERTLLFSNLGNVILSSLDSQNTLLSVLKLIKENFGFDRAACLQCDSQGRMTGPRCLWSPMRRSAASSKSFGWRYKLRRGSPKPQGLERLRFSPAAERLLASRVNRNCSTIYEPRRSPSFPSGRVVSRPGCCWPATYRAARAFQTRSSGCCATWPSRSRRHWIRRGCSKAKRGGRPNWS